MRSISRWSSAAMALSLGVSACSSSTVGAGGANRGGHDAGKTIGAAGTTNAATDASGLIAVDAGIPGALPEVSPSEFPLTKLDANGFTFDVRLAGPETGELVVLLHGFPETSFEWRHQMGALVNAGYRVLAPDQRGYSASARPAATDAYAIINLISDVMAMVDALGVDKFHVVGHDWGAGVAWGVGIVGGARLRTLTAISVPHPGAFNAALADQNGCQYNASAYFDVFTQPNSEDAFLADDASALKATYAEFPPEVSTEYLRVLNSKPALSAALNWYRANVENRMIKGSISTHITVPTMMIWSDQDPFLCRDGAELTKDYVDAPYHLEVITGVDHWVPELGAARATELLLKHFAQ
ncbi:MAG TPA: alpha/beta hydrolase [Polyangiaceae bacterium]